MNFLTHIRFKAQLSKCAQLMFYIKIFQFSCLVFVHNRYPINTKLNNNIMDGIIVVVTDIYGNVGVFPIITLFLHYIVVLIIESTLYFIIRKQ